MKPNCGSNLLQQMQKNQAVYKQRKPIISQDHYWLLVVSNTNWIIIRIFYCLPYILIIFLSPSLQSPGTRKLVVLFWSRSPPSYYLKGSSQSTIQAFITKLFPVDSQGLHLFHCSWNHLSGIFPQLTLLSKSESNINPPICPCWCWLRCHDMPLKLRVVRK